MVGERDRHSEHEFDCVSGGDEKFGKELEDVNEPRYGMNDRASITKLDVQCQMMQCRQLRDKGGKTFYVIQYRSESME